MPLRTPFQLSRKIKMSLNIVFELNREIQIMQSFKKIIFKNVIHQKKYFLLLSWNLTNYCFLRKGKTRRVMNKSFAKGG